MTSPGREAVAIRDSSSLDNIHGHHASSHQESTANVSKRRAKLLWIKLARENWIAFMTAYWLSNMQSYTPISRHYTQGALVETERVLWSHGYDWEPKRHLLSQPSIWGTPHPASQRTPQIILFQCPPTHGPLTRTLPTLERTISLVDYALFAASEEKTHPWQHQEMFRHQRQSNWGWQRRALERLRASLGSAPHMPDQSALVKKSTHL